MFDFIKKRKLKSIIVEALSDGEITDAEFDKIMQAKNELGLSEDYIHNLIAKHFNKAIQPILKRIRKSRRFSLDDEKEIIAIAKKFQVTPHFVDDLKIYRSLWEIETTGTFTPSPISVPIRLNKREECYHAASSVWAQLKVVRKHSGYVGASVGFRIAKGVTLRLGKAIPSVSKSEEIVDISSGTLYVTNKRLIFVGDKKSTNITFGRIISHEIYRDGIEIRKTSGRPDIFKLDSADVEFIDALFQVL